MSSATRRVAVAVSASTGMSPSCAFRSRSWRYAGRKSWPQWLMQWASSTTTRLIGQSAMMLRKPRRQRLGRDVQQLELAAAQLSEDAGRSASSSVELNSAARKPSRSSASTWSFISEISGERTSTVPLQQLGRDLKRQRLAGAGRHQADAVASGQHGVDDLALAGPEGLIAEERFEDLLGIVGSAP